MVKYGDFNKSADDVCGSDLYKFDNKLKFKTKQAGADLSAEGTLKDQKFTAKYSPVDGVTIKKFQATASGKLVVETNFSNLMDGLKCDLNFEGTTAGAAKKTELKINYAGDGFVSNTKINVLSAMNGAPIITEALAFKYDDFWFGGQGTFADGGLSKYDFGVNYAQSDFSTSIKAAPAKGDNWDVSASYWQKVDADTQVAAMVNLNAVGSDSASTDLVIGTSYKMDKTNTVSTKIGLDSSNSKDIPLSFGYSTKLSDAISLDSAASVNALNFGGDGAKFGVGFTVSV